LVVKDAKRSDTGPYTVVLKNPSGSADATIKVNVIGTTLLRSVDCVENIAGKYILRQLANIQTLMHTLD